MFLWVLQAQRPAAKEREPGMGGLVFKKTLHSCREQPPRGNGKKRDALRISGHLKVCKELEIIMSSIDYVIDSGNMLYSFMLFIS